MSELIEVYRDENFCPEKSGSSVTTVGTFDGVHLGHQEILERLAATDQGRLRTVVTFEPHPQTAMQHRPGVMPNLSNPVEKIRWLRAGGAERVFILRFTEELAQLSAEEFLEKILLDRLNSSKLIVGYNHSFGKDRKGNSEFLEQAKGKYGFDLEVVGPYYVGGEIVSSTKVRRSLGEGDVEKARQFLGRPYYLTGTVVAGRGIGREMKFPTANLQLTHQGKLIPKMGVYSVAVGVDNQVYPGMLNIGTRPTFGEGEITIEVHLIDYSGKLYGKTISLLFITRLREEKRFNSAVELIEQIKNDQTECLAIFQSQPPDQFSADLF